MYSLFSPSQVSQYTLLKRVLKISTISSLLFIICSFPAILVLPFTYQIRIVMDVADNFKLNGNNTHTPTHRCLSAYRGTQFFSFATPPFLLVLIGVTVIIL